MNQSYGTTSACAENTLHGIIHDPQIRNYLRVRGEYLPRAIFQPLG